MLTHPAVAVAQERTAVLGDFTAVAVRAREDIAAVLMDSAENRIIIIVENRDGTWTPPGMVTGTSRPAGPRATRTPDHLPLNRLSRKRYARLDVNGDRPEYSWCAIAGLAAQDATEISIVADGRETREPVDDDGLAFALARVHRDHEPKVYVHTRDGRVVAQH